jgi:hypothetical protein
MAGVSVRQMNHWTERGYLRPERVGNGDGTGTRFAWESRDISHAAILGALSSVVDKGSLLKLFAYTLATPESRDMDEVGIIVDTGTHLVTVSVQEVSRHGTNGKTTKRITS